MRTVKWLVAAISATAILTGGTALTMSASAEQAAGLPTVSAGDSRSAVKSLSTAQRTELQKEIDATLTTTKGGVQISANEISYNGGEPILTLPLPGQRRAPASSPAALREEGLSPSDVSTQVDWHGCIAGNRDNRWYCFYENTNFGGRRLQWNYAHCDQYINFADWNFQNDTSSWVNTTYDEPYWGMGIRVLDSAPQPDLLLWTENPWSMNSNVGYPDNERANYFYACRR